MQIENNFSYIKQVAKRITDIRLTNAVSKTGNSTKFKEKAGGTEWIIAILMGEVVAQDLN